MSERYDRNIRLFGEDGQEKLRKLKVSVVGVGGLGTHIIQQLAHFGVGSIALIDFEDLDITNLNRYVGTRLDHVGESKVHLGKLIINSIDPDIQVNPICESLVSKNAFNSIKKSDYVFGCLDCEGARLILNELCLAYDRPYFDLSSDINPGPPTIYGGRVCFVSDLSGCLYCLGELDIAEASLILSGPHQRDEIQAIYGVDTRYLGKTGPSVVSINGVIASLAVTEFMVDATGLRQANTLIKYYGEQSIVRKSKDKGLSDCYNCQQIRGKGDAAEVDRYVEMNVGEWLNANKWVKWGRTKPTS